MSRIFKIYLTIAYIRTSSAFKYMVAYNIVGGNINIGEGACDLKGLSLILLHNAWWFVLVQVLLSEKYPRILI